MTSRHLPLYGLLIVTTCFLTGCISLKPGGGGGSGKKLFEAFYVGDEGTQYFIKPLDFESESDGKLRMDITFKYKDEVKDSAIVNLSLIVTEVVRDLQSVSLSNPSISISTEQLEYMFSERKKKDYINRYSINIPLADLERLFADQNWTILAKNPDKSYTFSATRSARKKIGKIDYQIFDLF